MRNVRRLWVPAMAGWLLLGAAAQAQVRPYIGYVYPAGGQRGTTFQVRLGGQGLDDVDKVLVTGEGVRARVVDYYRRLNNQEVQLLNEQMRELRRATSAVASAMAPAMVSDDAMMASESTMMMSAPAAGKKAGVAGKSGAAQKLLTMIEKRTREHVQTPACASIASLVMVEVKIDPNAEAGPRELRLATPRGVSNPLVFHVGPLPEHSRKPMTTATIQVLGKEAAALRKRPENEVEVRIKLPCTMNGQIASGEVNRYRFEARKGQRLVITTYARQLIPYIADAVPGWIQPVLELYDAKGKELAFSDDYRFKPDPVILFEVPADGEYVVAIHDSIYRGREDFVYRVSIGELPFVTSLFPLGGQLGTPVKPSMRGWNLKGAVLTPPVTDGLPGIQWLSASKKGLGHVSNRMPFALDLVPDCPEREPNDSESSAQTVTLPIIINGSAGKRDDWDIYEFSGKSNDIIVAEVQARRLDSPLDSVLKLTDSTGRLLAFNDDREDLGAGVNTHQADSYFMATLPADGVYRVHLGDTARKGGEEYGYRLRLSAPQPDFELRVVPSSIALRGRTTGTLSVYAIRKDGFTGPIKLALKDPPPGITATPVTLSGTQAVARLTLKSGVAATKEPVRISVVGSAKTGDKELVREAVPAEDRMQAFLWRHLVPAEGLVADVFDPSYVRPARRAARSRPAPAAMTNSVTAAQAPATTNATSGSVTSTAAKPKFTKQQVNARLRQLKLLYEDGLLTDDFYDLKVAECEAGQ